MARRPMQRWERVQERIASSPLGAWLAVNVASRIDRRLLRLTKGRVGTYLGQPVGLLETVGRRSGEPRSTPLLYLDDATRVILVASKGGAPSHPAWYHNLHANPDVRFMRRGGERRRYRARLAEGAEREQLWARVNDLYAGYETYQGWTPARRIPVVVLEPQE